MKHDSNMVESTNKQDSAYCLPIAQCSGASNWAHCWPDGHTVQIYWMFWWSSFKAVLAPRERRQWATSMQRCQFLVAALSLNAESAWLRFSDFPWSKSFLWCRGSKHVSYCHIQKSSQTGRRIACQGLMFVDSSTPLKIQIGFRAVKCPSSLRSQSWKLSEQDGKCNFFFQQVNTCLTKHPLSKILKFLL